MTHMVFGAGALSITTHDPRHRESGLSARCNEQVSAWDVGLAATDLAGNHQLALFACA
jgi:hypothetical protein